MFNDILENDIKIKNLLQKESDLLNFTFNGNKMVDLCRCLNCSLKNASDNFKINADKCKLDFDHTKINNWNDVENYKSEVLPYLKNDLLATGINKNI